VARKKPPTQRTKFIVLLFDEPEGGYSVEIPELPGCFTEGDTVEEALANAREAIACHLDPHEPAASRKVRVMKVEM
jgi:predicted RNase H-like HicB family nuclease